MFVATPISFLCTDKFTEDLHQAPEQSPTIANDDFGAMVVVSEDTHGVSPFK